MARDNRLVEKIARYSSTGPAIWLADIGTCDWAPYVYDMRSFIVLQMQDARRPQYVSR